MASLITGAAGLVALNSVEHPLGAGRDVVGRDRIAMATGKIARDTGFSAVVGI